MNYVESVARLDVSYNIVKAIRKAMSLAIFEGKHGFSTVS